MIDIIIKHNTKKVIFFFKLEVQKYAILYDSWYVGNELIKQSFWMLLDMYPGLIVDSAYLFLSAA